MRKDKVQKLVNKKDWEDKDITYFIDTILSLPDKKTAIEFFRDVATIGELKELSLRWKAARLLDLGHPVREVVDITGLSLATVNRVNIWRQVGTGGYNKMIKVMDKPY